MELLCSKAGPMHFYGVTIDDTQLALLLLSNIALATSKDWGQEFCQTLQIIRRCYAYNYVHNTTSITNMLHEFATADGVRKLNDAPAPTGTATLSLTMFPSSRNFSNSKQWKPMPKPPPPYTQRVLLLPKHHTNNNVEAVMNMGTHTTIHALEDMVIEVGLTTHPTHALIGGNKPDVSPIPTSKRTLASGTSATKGTEPGGSAMRWRSCTHHTTNSLRTWVGTGARAVMMFDGVGLRVLTVLDRIIGLLLKEETKQQLILLLTQKNFLHQSIQ